MLSASAVLNMMSAAANTMSAPSNAMSAPSIRPTMSAPPNTMSAPSNAMSAPSNAMSAPSNAMSAPSNAMSVPSNAMSAPNRPTMSATTNTMSATTNTTPVKKKRMSPKKKTMSDADNAAATTRKKGKTIHSSERQCILNVIKRCDEEAERKCLLTPLNKATERAAYYCCVGDSTIKRIRGEAKKAGGNTPSFAKFQKRKKQKKSTEGTINAGNFDRRVIKETIEEFYVKHRTLPTTKNLLPVLKEKIGFKWGERSLRQLLINQGYKWKKCGSKRKKILMEKPSIVNGRGDYLKRIAKLREEGRDVLYVGETWVDTDLLFKKGGVPKPNRLIIGHIGGSRGFIEECGLVYKAGQMTADNFYWWIREKVLPALNKPSVIVMNNASYHCEQSDIFPKKTSLKKDMIEFLRSKNIAVDQRLRRFELFELIEQIKPKTKVYKVDELLRYYGHTVLRLPQFVSDMNPIELAWKKVKNYIKTNGKTEDMSISTLETLVLAGMKSVTPRDWYGYCNDVIKIEKEYWTKDSVVEDAIEAVIASLGEDLSDSSDEDSSDDSN